MNKKINIIRNIFVSLIILILIFSIWLYIYLHFSYKSYYNSIYPFQDIWCYTEDDYLYITWKTVISEWKIDYYKINGNLIISFIKDEKEKISLPFRIKFNNEISKILYKNFEWNEYEICTWIFKK